MWYSSNYAVNQQMEAAIAKALLNKNIATGGDAGAGDNTVDASNLFATASLNDEPTAVAAEEAAAIAVDDEAEAVQADEEVAEAVSDEEDEELKALEEEIRKLEEEEAAAAAAKESE